ncbi:MAG: cytochrome C oxidase subunit IV [Flavobacteriales bacterium]|nr:cytochrome C oxidase subunit IV [Flavobacteriales bacterium]|tara:strand:+ start:587 stop:910 length:324 start_codon:yes stop_codon:yes gene_type:complete
MSDNQHNGNWWIWKVFWILLGLTTFEVLLGMFKPAFLVNTIFLGTKLLNHVFIILTIIKAAYIVLIFMHLGFEKKSLKWTILLPALVLVPYLLFIILSEGVHAYIIL